MKVKSYLGDLGDLGDLGKIKEIKINKYIYIFKKS
jgi:hypothetical protein